MRFSVSADEQRARRGGQLPGPAGLPGARGIPGQPLPGWNFSQLSGQAPELPANDQGEPATHPDLGWLDWDDDADEDERYIPPRIPPQPKLDPVARAAWTALFGGPGYLFFATTLEWQVPGWAQLAAIIAFVAGFVVLVSRLGDGPSRRDGPDQGAVV